MLPAFWIQVNARVQLALVVLCVQKYTFRDIRNQNADDLN
jgi:hypothetical protein